MGDVLFLFCAAQSELGGDGLEKIHTKHPGLQEKSQNINEELMGTPGSLRGPGRRSSWF